MTIFDFSDMYKWQFIHFKPEGHYNSWTLTESLILPYWAESWLCLWDWVTTATEHVNRQNNQSCHDHHPPSVHSVSSKKESFLLLLQKKETSWAILFTVLIWTQTSKRTFQWCIDQSAVSWPTLHPSLQTVHNHTTMAANAQNYNKVNKTRRLRTALQLKN